MTYLGYLLFLTIRHLLFNGYISVFAFCCSAKVTCSCVSPNAGTVNKNQYKCTDGTSAWCASTETCYATSPFTKGDWASGCTAQVRYPHEIRQNATFTPQHLSRNGNFGFGSQQKKKMDLTKITQKI